MATEEGWQTPSYASKQGDAAVGKAERRITARTATTTEVVIQGRLTFNDLYSLTTETFKDMHGDSTITVAGDGDNGRTIVTAHHEAVESIKW